MKNHKAKKSLGQNFLKSEKILSQIVTAGEIEKEETVLEIGPGKGALTAKLLESGARVIAVETDYELYEFLKNKFAKEIDSGKLDLISGDILEFNPSNYGLDPGSYKIIANIPYNITGAILKKFLTDSNQPQMMVLLVQHEVAKRIMGEKSGEKESLLSVSVKIYGEPKIITKVPAMFFSPKPKVDSAVIKINEISREKLPKMPNFEENFWKIARAGFAHKRKKLEKNLKNIISTEILSELGFLGKRAEDLSPKDWLSLAQKCYN